MSVAKHEFEAYIIDPEERAKVEAQDARGERAQVVAYLETQAAHLGADLAAILLLRIAERISEGEHLK